MDKRQKNNLNILYLSSKLVLKTIAAVLFIAYASDFFLNGSNQFFHWFLNPLGDLLDEQVTENPDGFPFHWRVFFTPINLLSFMTYHFLFFIYDSLFSINYWFCWGLCWGGYLYLLGVWSLYPWIFFWVGHGRVRDRLIKIPKSLFTTRAEVISSTFEVQDLEQVQLLFKSKEVWIMRNRYDRFLWFIARHQDMIWKFPRLANFIKNFYFKYGYLEWILFSIYNNPFYLFDLGRHWFFIYSREHWIELIQWVLFTFMTVCLDLYYFIVINGLFSLENMIGSFVIFFRKKWEPEQSSIKESILILGSMGQMILHLIRSLALLWIAYKFWLPLFFIFKLFSLYFVFIVEGPWREKLKLGWKACGMLFRLSFFYIYFYYGWFLAKLLVQQLPQIRTDYKNIYAQENISGWDIYEFYIHRLFNITLILMDVFTNIVKDLVYHFCENLQILKKDDPVFHAWNIHLDFLKFDPNKNMGEVINFSRLFK